MFSLEQINQYKEEYVDYSNNIIPSITDIKYDLQGDSNGLVKSNELSNVEVILHLNPEIFKYHSKYQVGILWHEFTHIYDELNCPFKSDTKKQYMKSLSEIKATSFEYKYLLGMRAYDNILYDTNKKVHFMNYHKKFESILIYYDECSKMAFNNFIKTLSVKDFNNAMNSFMYLCGATKITYHNSFYIKNKLALYPNDFSTPLDAMVDLIYSNNDKQVCKAYEILQKIAASKQIKQVEEGLR